MQHIYKRNKHTLLRDDDLIDLKGKHHHSIIYIIMEYERP